MAFVSNGSWLDGNAQDGFRKTMEKEFSKIYVFNLRGNCRTSGELRKKKSWKRIRTWQPHTDCGNRTCKKEWRIR